MMREAQAVHDLFTPIAPTYRVANRALTFGLDGYWRWRAARRALRGDPASALDVCAGTGEMAGCLRRFGRGRVAVTAVDFCEAMLDEARRRSGADAITFLLADASRLPFTNESFDVTTISFALRNLNVTADRFAVCLRECLRVLRPGGRLITVETTQPPRVLVRWVLRRFLGIVVPRLGAWLSGSRPAYAYLSGTISRFHGAPQLAAILRDIGFGRVNYRYLTFGLVAIHQAVKPAARENRERMRIDANGEHDERSFA